MRIAITTLLLAIGLVGQAVSQELEDDVFVSDYFGTSAIIFCVEPLVDSEIGWWSDLLPDELLYGSDFVAGLVNGYRIGKGEDLLIPPDASVVMSGWEEPVEGGYIYNLDFIGLRPSEVELVFEALGGMEKYLGIVEITFMPLIHQDYYEYTESLDGPVEITIGSQVVNIDTTQHIGEVLEQLGKVLTEEYGYHTINYISLSYSIYEDTESVVLSFNVELPAG